MTEKLKCPQCGRCVGISIANGLEVYTQVFKPQKIPKNKAVICKTCQRCRIPYYLLVREIPKVA